MRTGVGIGVLLVSALGGACGGDASNVDCGRGRLVRVGGESYCTYADGIVIEGGFQCPEELPYLIRLDDAAVCASAEHDPGELPPAVCSSVGRQCLPLLDATRPPPSPDALDAGRDAAPGADAAGAVDAGPGAGGPGCRLSSDPDCLLLTRLDGVAPDALRDECGGFAVAATAGVATAAQAWCGGALAVPYSDGGGSLGPGFGIDGIEVTGSDALSLDVNPVLTIEARVFALALDPGGAVGGPKPTVVRQSDGQYRLFVYDGRPGVVLGSLCGPFMGYRWALSPDPLPLSRWVHLVAVIDGIAERVELYVDGVLAASADSGPCSPPGASSGGIRIGNSGGNDVFPGYLDEVRIRRGALPP